MTTATTLAAASPHQKQPQQQQQPHHSPSASSSTTRHRHSHGSASTAAAHRLSINVTVHRLLRPGRGLPGPRKLLVDAALISPGCGAALPGPHELVESVQLRLGNSIVSARLLPVPTPDGAGCAFLMPEWLDSPTPAGGAPSLRLAFRTRLVAQPSHLALPLPSLWAPRWSVIERIVQLTLTDEVAAVVQPPTVNGLHSHQQQLNGGAEDPVVVQDRSVAIEVLDALSAATSAAATIESLSGVSLSEQHRLAVVRAVCLYKLRVCGGCAWV